MATPKQKQLLSSEYRTMVARMEYAKEYQYYYTYKSALVDLIKARIKAGTCNLGADLITNPDNPGNVY